MLIPDVLLVMLAEFMVDWVKHAFITKFNEISFEVNIFVDTSRDQIIHNDVTSLFFCF